MGQLLANKAATTLASGIGTGDLSLTPVSTTGFPTITGSDYFWATLANAADTLQEIVKVTATGASFTIVRAQDGTTAQNWASGSRLEVRTNAQMLRDLSARIVPDVETSVAIPASSIDLSQGNVFSKTISGTVTFTLANVPAAGTAICFLLDLTNSSGSAVWWSGVKWAGGAAPVLTTSGRDLFGFLSYDGGTTWIGLVLGKDVK